jgi:HEAT repeat protein
VRGAILELNRAFPSDKRITNALLTIAERSGDPLSLLSQIAAISVLARHVSKDPVVLAALVRRCKDPAPSVRMAAVDALSVVRSEDPAAISAIYDASSDPSPIVRSRALAAMVQRYPTDQKTLAIIFSALRDTDEDVRISAVEALGSIGPRDQRVIPNLLALGSSADQSVRTAAWIALAGIDPTTPDIVAGIRQRLYGDPTTAEEAANAIATIGSRDFDSVSEIVLSLFNNKDPIIHSKMVRVVADRGQTDPSLLPLIISAAQKDPDPLTRSDMVRVIAARARADPSLLPLIIDAAENDPDPSIRQVATGLLGPFSSSELILPALVRATHDPAPGVRDAAHAAIAPNVLISNDTRETLISGLSDPDPNIQSKAIEGVLRTANETIKGNRASLFPFFRDGLSKLKTLSNLTEEQTLRANALTMMLDDRTTIVRALQYVYGHYPITAFLSIVGALWITFCYGLYVVCPYFYLKIVLKLKANKISLPLKAIVEIPIPLHFLILGWLWNRPRLLDIWIRKHMDTADYNFRSRPTVSARSHYVTSPIDVNGEVMTQLRPEYIRPCSKKGQSY